LEAADLRLEELVQFSDGLISLHGRRLILHDIHAIAQFRSELVDSLGAEQSRRILTRFGFFWGQADAAAMKRIFRWKSDTECLLALKRLNMLQGIAKTVVKSIDVNPKGQLRMEITWHGSAEAEEQLIAPSPAGPLGCRILEGYASGYASFCLARPVYFVEQSCKARMERLCTALGQDLDHWGRESETFLRYFQADDIKGKIDFLTAELKTRMRELQHERKLVRELQIGRPGMAEIRSKAFQHVLDLSTRVARFDTSVLVTGESGVGKEVLARYIHRKSHRSGGPFVAINCGALPETLLESELFGHKAGSFTGAIRDRAGLFEEAQGGTILLDEIADISLDLQVKLLRVLQEKEIRRVGENKSRRVDVRVIAATNRKLESEVLQKRFREDLLYRLRVVEIHVPPLRERPEDILPLARFLTDRLAKELALPGLTLDATVLHHLQACPWPGNVRELENALERAAVMSDDRRIRPQNLPASVLEAGSGRLAGGRTLSDVERAHVLAVLSQCGGNKTKAAEVLGVGTTTLWRKLKQYGRVRAG
jgi:two-component system response regulator HydG